MKAKLKRLTSRPNEPRRNVHTLENWERSASAGVMPRLEQILLVRPGHDDPENTSVPLMTGWIL